MVKISTSLVVAAIVLQGLAAPLPENREHVNKRAVAPDGKKFGPKLGSAQLNFEYHSHQNIKQPEARDLKESHQLERRFGRIGMVVPHGGFHSPRGGAMRGHALSAREVDVEELESREPRISGAQLRSVGHHVKSGIELAATVAPLLHQRSIEDDIELDARERGRHFNGARPFVGRGGFGITRGGLQAREVEESLEAREPRISGAQLRTVGHHVKSGIELAATVAPLLHQRSIEAEEQQLERRFGGHFYGGMRHFGRMGGGLAGVQSREIELTDDIEAREPRISGSQLKSIAHHVRSGVEFGATVAPLLQQRSEDELELDARDPFSFGKFFKGAVKGAGKVAGNFLKREDLEDGEILAREFNDAELEELAARDPFNFGKFLKGAAKDAGKVAGTFIKREDMEDEDMFARELNDAELEELAAREPFFLTKILKGATKVAGNFLRREDEDGVYIREFEIDELD